MGAKTVGYHTPNTRSYKAGADLSDKVGHFVKRGTVVGTVVLATAATDVTLGVILGYGAGHTGLSGEVVNVALPGGGALVKMAGAVATGLEVSPNAAGKAAASATGNRVGAILEPVETTTAADDLVAALVVAPYQLN